MSSRTQAVLIGGAFTGVLSALPIVSLANCCCLWLIGGGVVASYLLQQGQTEPVEIGDGAVVGCLAGVVGAFVHTAVSIPIQLATRPMQRQMAELLRDNAEVPPEVAEMLDQLSMGGPIVLLVGFIFMLVLGAVFSTLGGILGVVIFRRDRVASTDAPPDIPLGPG